MQRAHRIKSPAVDRETCVIAPQLAADLLKFTEAVHHLDTPEAVLGALDAITWSDCRAHVLGAALLPLNFGASDSGGQDGFSTQERAERMVGGSNAAGRKVTGTK